MNPIAKPVFLYVEDDANSRTVIEILLKQVMAYEHVTLFDSSANFIERFKAITPSPTVVFLDLHLSPLNGYQIIKLLHNDLNSPARVIALTANVMADDIVELKRMGFDGLIGKPIVSSVFADLIGKILQGDTVWYVP